MAEQPPGRAGPAPSAGSGTDRRTRLAYLLALSRVVGLGAISIAINAMGALPYLSYLSRHPFQSWF